MFETVAPGRVFKPSRKAFYEALPFSIAVHALAGMAALTANVWTVVFPQQAPPQSVAFAIADIPPPPPPPPPPAAPKATPKNAVVQKVLPTEIVAPNIIPDEIPVVSAQPIITEVVEGTTDGVEGGVPGGVAGGVVDGVEGGTVGGVIGGVIGGIVTENRVVIERDKPLPMFPMSQVYPKYPEGARLRAWEDALVVRYVIGKDGRVKEVSVISAPEHSEFVDGTLNAIRHWRFRPMIRDGERQEVVHELTIFYRLNG